MVSMVALAGRRTAERTASATVSGDIILRRGACVQRVFQIFVSVAPASSPMTRMPRGRSSFRGVLVKTRAACFLAGLAGDSAKKRGGASERFFTLVAAFLILV